MAQVGRIKAATKKGDAAFGIWRWLHLLILSRQST
jgi:hypothetical protein